MRPLQWSLLQLTNHLTIQWDLLGTMRPLSISNELPSGWTLTIHPSSLRTSRKPCGSKLKIRAAVTPDCTLSRTSTCAPL